MDKKGTDPNSGKSKLLGCEKVVLNGDKEVDSESEALLPPRRGGTSRKTEKTKRKVQWKDRNGNKLTEVKEFQPSDESDSDEDDLDSCICTIM